METSYIDADNDDPNVKKVFIDGDGKDLDGYGSNEDYTLNILGSDIGRGDHTYYFYFEDGHGGTAQTTEKTFSIKRNRAINHDRHIFLEAIFDHFPFLLKLLRLV